MTTTSDRHDARLGFRLSRAQKETIERAALVSGQSVSDFAASSLLRLAEDVLDRQRTRTLSDRDRDTFLALLASVEGPNAALRAAADDYKCAVAEERSLSE